MEESWSDTFVVQRTPVLNWFLHFLSDLDLEEEEIDTNELQKIKASLNPQDKPVFHLILLGLLDDEEVQAAFKNEDNEDVFSSIVNLTERLDVTISADVYLEIVLGMGLIEEWLAMIMANPRAKVMASTVEALIARVIQGEERGYKDMIETLLVSLLKVARVLAEFEPLQPKEKYFPCFRGLCMYVLGSPCLTDSDRLVLMFRMIGIAILKIEDYETDTETAGLLQEWQLDETLLDPKSVKLYESFLKQPVLDWKASGVSNELLLMLDSVVAALQDKVCKETEILEGDQIYRGNMTQTDYIGGCAYLVNLIAQKHQVELGNFPSVSNLVQVWIEQKPKLQETDFDFDSQDFIYFCRLMKECGDRGMNSYKQDWIAKFLTFSADDVVGTKEGAEITEKFILGSAQETVLEYLGKVSQFEGELSSGQKLVVIKVLTEKESSGEETSDRIRRVFKKVTNAKLRLEDFSVSANTLCAQLSTIEFEKDPTMLAKHRLEVIRICVQDPLTAVSRLLEQSIRTEHFKALEFARTFFSLKALQKDDSDEIQLPETLLSNDFNKLLKYLPQYPDSVYGLVSSGIEYLISTDALLVEDVFAVFKFRLLKLLSGDRVALGIGTGVVILLTDYVEFLGALKGDKDLQSLVNEITDFVIRLYRFLALYTNRSTFSHAMLMRSQLVKIQHVLKEKLGVRNFALTTDLTLDNLEEMNLFDIGILYVRCEDARPLIIESVGNDDIVVELDYTECVRNTVLLVSNSCEPEWPSVIKFLFEVVLKSNRKYKQKCFSKLDLFNESLLAMFPISVEMNIQDSFVHMLKFYDFALEELKKDKGTFKVSDRKCVLDTLMTLALAMGNSNHASNKHKNRKRHETLVSAPGLFSVLSNLLGKVQEAITSKSGMEESARDHLVNKLDRFPVLVLDCKCQTIIQLIVNQLKSEKDN